MNKKEEDWRAYENTHKSDLISIIQNATNYFGNNCPHCGRNLEWDITDNEIEEWLKEENANKKCPEIC